MPFAARLHAEHVDGSILEKGIKKADGVGAAADTGHEQIRQALFLFQNLPARLVADDALKIAHHERIGMRAIDRAEDVMGVADVGHPVAHGLVDGLLEGLLAGGDGHDLRAEHFHAIDVERLALAIHFAHVDDAFQAEHGGDGGGGDAVLAGAGFGDDAGLAHAPGEQDLADGVVDFMRAGVEQVFALEINFRRRRVPG